MRSNLPPISWGGGGGVVKRKPVIYLQSSLPQTVKITVHLPEKNEYFTELDPLPNCEEKKEETKEDETNEINMKGARISWIVRTQSDGGITLNNSDSSSSPKLPSFPYLFWESKMDEDKETERTKYRKMHINIKDNNLVCLQSNHVQTWLQRTLKLYGLNERQINDFIEYWVPIITKNPYSLIRFLNPDEIETAVAKLTISPLPTKLLRVFMIFRQPSKKERTLLPLTVPEKEVEKYENFTVEKSFLKDFTVVEWGGCNLEE